MTNDNVQKSSLLTPARRNVLATLIGRGLSIGLNLLATLWTIRYLGPEKYGTYIWVVSLITLLDLAGEISLFEITIREMAKNPSSIPHWLGAVTQIRVWMGISLAVILVVVSWLYPLTSESTRILQIGALVFFFSSLRTPITYFRAQLLIHWELGLWVITRTIELGMIAWIITHQGNVVALMTAKAIATGIFSATLWSVLWSAYGIRCSMAENYKRPLLTLAIPLGITALLMLIQLKGDILIIGKILGPVATGAFGAIAQIPEFVLVASTILNATLGPLLARSLGQNDFDDFQRIFQKFLSLLALSAMPLAVFATLFAEPVVRWVFGSDYLNMLHQFRVMVWVGAILPLAGVMGVTAVTLNLQRKLVRVEAVNVFIFIIGNFLLLPWMGTIASAWIRLLVILIGPTWTYLIIRKHFPCRLPRHLLAQAVLAALSAWTFGWLLRTIL